MIKKVAHYCEKSIEKKKNLFPYTFLLLHYRLIIKVNKQVTKLSFYIPAVNDRAQYIQSIK